MKIGDKIYRPVRNGRMIKEGDIWFDLKTKTFDGKTSLIGSMYVRHPEDKTILVREVLPKLAPNEYKVKVGEVIRKGDFWRCKKTGKITFTTLGDSDARFPLYSVTEKDYDLIRPVDPNILRSENEKLKKQLDAIKAILKNEN